MTADEKQRDKVLARILEHIKVEFQKIGFVELGNFFSPVTQLGPFDVGPRRFQDQLMTMLRK
eukprot:8377901-Ditylum_brightwellii.AAC.1